MWDQPPHYSTYTALLDDRAKTMPAATAYGRLSRDSEIEDGLTYVSLRDRSIAIARALSERGMSGRPVLILLPSDLHFITALLGCFYAGAIAVPLFPPRRNQSFRRLKAIVTDSRSTLAITDAASKTRVNDISAVESWLNGLEWLDVEQAQSEFHNSAQLPPIDCETLALLQYTSGSTSSPRGVKVLHRHLLLNSQKMWEPLAACAGKPVVGWLPMHHDLGLMGNVLGSLYGAVPYLFMTPDSFLLHPLRWLRAISHHGAGISGAPNFAYDLCVSRTKPGLLDGLDLTPWKIAFCGAEPIRFATLQRFANTFADYGFDAGAFYASYGLAEATLFVTGGIPGRGVTVKEVNLEALRGGSVDSSAENGPKRNIVSCGRLWTLNHSIRIVDPNSGKELPVGQVGEIWLRGEGVASGYWNHPALTEATFSATIAESGEAGFLRTGDLGFLADDELYVTGRLKELIIVGGENHYPQDIEHTIAEVDNRLHADSCAVFTIQRLDGEQCIAVAELKREKPADKPKPQQDLRTVIRDIRRAVTDTHNIGLAEIALIRPTTLPRTTSNKVQRIQCRTDYEQNLLEFIARG